MIVTTLRGGLGNQMFIYAMARAMALRNNVPMAFDLETGFKRDIEYHRHLELDKFSIDLPRGGWEAFDMPYGFVFKKISSKLGRHILHPRYKVISENEVNYHFQEEFLNKSLKDVYLNGYWQSSEYFKDFADIIREDFTIDVKLPEQTLSEYQKLKSAQRPLVMVGIRRYQEVKNANCPLTVCDSDYYNRAMEYVSGKLSNPLFVIFGEQRDWGEKHLNSKYDMYFVEQKHGDLSAISDLYLMRNCDHAIISNSSYYWWGCWLQVANQKEHIVIAPNNFINPITPCKEWTVLV